jgi:hypothetical protein
MVNREIEQKRETDGRYAYDGNYDRLCVCGHTLGVHSAGSPADCLFYSFSEEEKAQERNSGKHLMVDADCGCHRFRLSRKKQREADHA